MNNSNNGIDTSIRNVVDGEGTVSAISISDDQMIIRPNNENINKLKMNNLFNIIDHIEIYIF